MKVLLNLLVIPYVDQSCVENNRNEKDFYGKMQYCTRHSTARKLNPLSSPLSLISAILGEHPKGDRLSIPITGAVHVRMRRLLGSALIRIPRTIF